MGNQYTVPDHQYVLSVETQCQRGFICQFLSDLVQPVRFDLAGSKIRQMSQRFVRQTRQRFLQILQCREIEFCNRSVPSRAIASFATDTSDNVQRPVHRPEMNAGEVFADYAKSEKLCAGKDGNDGGDKRKSRDTSLEKDSGQ